MAHIKRKSDGRLFNIISGKILSAEEVQQKNITASFLMLESDDEAKEKTMTMYAPLGENAFELLAVEAGFEAKLPKAEYIAAAEAEMAPLIEEAQQVAMAEQQARLAEGDNILDITPLRVENTYNQLEELINFKNEEELYQTMLQNQANFGTGSIILIEEDEREINDLSGNTH